MFFDNFYVSKSKFELVVLSTKDITVSDKVDKGA